jgi:hypothetical protein
LYYHGSPTQSVTNLEPVERQRFVNLRGNPVRRTSKYEKPSNINAGLPFKRNTRAGLMIFDLFYNQFRQAAAGAISKVTGLGFQD